MAATNSVIGGVKAGVEEAAKALDQIAARAAAWVPALNKCADHEREAMGDSSRAVVAHQEEVVVDATRALNGCEDVLVGAAQQGRRIAESL